MVKIILYTENLQRKEKVSGLFEYKEKQLISIENLYSEKFISSISLSFKVFLTINDLSDLKLLRDICSRYEDIEVIIEVPPHLYDTITHSKTGWFSNIWDIVEICPKKNNG